MKKFITGFIIGVLLTGTISFAASNLTAVKSVFVTIVNGKTVKQDIVTINNTYYADVKQMAGNLGMKYAVDTKGKKIILGEVTEQNKYTKNNPAPVGTKQTISSGQYKANITVKEIIRGDKVGDLIKKDNENKSQLEKGYEYIFAKIKFDLTDADENRAIFIFNSAFTLVSETGKEYEPIPINELPAQTLNVALFKGGSEEGWVVFKVKADDKKPVITYKVYDGTGSLWFKAY